jgi:hypothetical protein
MGLGGYQVMPERGEGTRRGTRVSERSCPPWDEKRAGDVRRRTSGAAHHRGKGQEDWLGWCQELPTMGEEGQEDGRGRGLRAAPH